MSHAAEAQAPSSLQSASCDIIIDGPSAPLCGVVKIPGSKNSALPIVAAAALCPSTVHLSQVPEISDIDSLLALLACIGVEFRKLGPQVALGNAGVGNSGILPTALTSRFRGSIYAAAIPAVANGFARLGMVGGDVLIGRSLDSHFKIFEQFGFSVTRRVDCVDIEGRLRPAKIDVNDRPAGISPTALAIILASAADGASHLLGITDEPEIRELLLFVAACGVEVFCNQRGTVNIRGPFRPSSEVKWTLSLDRTVWGTYAIAAGLTGGTMMLPALPETHMIEMETAFRSAGLKAERHGERGYVISGTLQAPITLLVSAFPSFPPDLAPIAAVLMAATPGRSTLEDRVYPGRFDHLLGLRAMGLRAVTRGSYLEVEGGRPLLGTTVVGTGIRESTALVMAGLIADGTTVIRNAHATFRGYPAFDEALRDLGAKVKLQREMLSG